MQSVSSGAVAESMPNYYSTGSYSFTTDAYKMIVSGYITSSSSRISFILPIYWKPGKTVNITNLSCAGRTGLGGYIEDSGNRKLNMTDYNFELTYRDGFGVFVNITKKNSSAFVNATTSGIVPNNSACVIGITDLEFTVS